MSDDTPTVSNAVTVFLSYRHATEAEDAEVLALSDRLREDGVDATVDCYVQHPPEGWAKWMEKQYNEKQYIVVVISREYLEEFNQVRPTSSGARFEGALLSAALLAKGVDYSRVAVVIMRPEHDVSLPPVLFGCQRYYMYHSDGYEKLYRFLTQQPSVSAPRLGVIKQLPSRSTLKSHVALPRRVHTLSELCLQLLPLMDENKRIFEDFGPKSGANADVVRWDTLLWQRIRCEKIVPVNSILRELINANWSVLPSEHKTVFRKLLSHIDAFEEHVCDPDIDYRDHQFPIEINEIVERNA